MFTSIVLETFAASDTGMFGSRKETVKKALVCVRRLHADDASTRSTGRAAVAPWKRSLRWRESERRFRVD
jgi:hypothetical protein